MSNAWNKISEPVDVQKLTDIISDEYVKVRQSRKERKSAKHFSDSNIITSGQVSPETSQHMEKLFEIGHCKSDTTVAKALQCKFPNVNDDETKLFNKKCSGDADVSVMTRSGDVPEYPFESDSEGELYTNRKDGNRSKTNNKAFENFLRRCIVTKDGRMVTKNGVSDISGEPSSCREMALSLEIYIEDDEGFDMKLSNTAFNQLNEHTLWNHTCRHKSKILDHKESQLYKDTNEMGLDDATRLILFKLINNKMLLDIKEVIATGKESIILHANTDPTYPEMVLPKECAIKVFKMILNDFKVRNKYIKPKHRFKYNFSNPVSKVLQMWAEKEMNNLMTLKKVGLNCPEIVCLKKHILVMSFIGKDKKPAPKLKEVIMEPDKWQSAYDEIVDGMYRLYNVGHLILPDHLVHNILWWENKCWYISVAQSIQPDHPNALKVLFRNCYFITQFFMKKRMTNMKNTQDLFKYVTGLKKYDWQLWNTVTNPKGYLM